MSKIKKICFIIMFAICICLFMQNISTAGWVTDGGFRRSRYRNNIYTWSVRPVESYQAHNDKGKLKTYYKIHITDNIYIDRINNASKRCFGNKSPKLDWNARSSLFTAW